MPRTLEGLTVVDLTQNIVGPYCTQLLGDFGADVIKVERPEGGDDVHRYAPIAHGESAAFLSFNRNKRSVCVDIGRRQAARSCAASPLAPTSSPILSSPAAPNNSDSATRLSRRSTRVLSTVRSRFW
jgi:hypothetical protein